MPPRSPPAAGGRWNGDVSLPLRPARVAELVASELDGTKSLEKDNNWKTLVILVSLVVAGFSQTTLVRLVPQWVGEWLGYADWLLLVTVYIAMQRNPMSQPLMPRV
ncbi:MAG: hypothetical protein EBZ36_10475 [Acidobacteria bacterium]|nr:hypothetical protein [Acidobacteriota bacterium]